ncbi:hypothetical protein Tco_1071257 [Tanacetum coccineum]
MRKELHKNSQDNKVPRLKTSQEKVTINLEVDWCAFIHSCLQHSAVLNTLHGFYIGPLTFLISVCSLIEEKLKIISEEKAELEDLLRKSTVVETEDVVDYVVNEPQEEKFEEETFTQWIKANIKWVREDDLFVWPWKVQSVNVQCPETPKEWVYCSFS